MHLFRSLCRYTLKMLAKRKQAPEWFLEPPPAPVVTSNPEESRKFSEEFEEWTKLAIFDLRLFAAKARERGSLKNLSHYIGQIEAASRQAFEARSNVSGLAREARKIANDCRRQASKYSDIPEMTERFLAQADRADASAVLYERQAKSHLRLVEAYSETLQQLALVQNEVDDTATKYAQIFGPLAGGAFLGGLLVAQPIGVGILVGGSVGLLIGMVRRAEIARQGVQ